MSGFALQRDLDKAAKNEKLETGLSRLLKAIMLALCFLVDNFYYDCIGF